MLSKSFAMRFSNIIHSGEGLGNRTQPAFPRPIVGLVLLAGYQILMSRLWLAQVLAAPHGGPAGALGWTGLLILCTVCADLYFDANRRCARSAGVRAEVGRVLPRHLKRALTGHQLLFTRQGLTAARAHDASGLQLFGPISSSSTRHRNPGPVGLHA